MSQPGMTIVEAARHLGLSHRTVRSYIARGLLTTFRMDGDRKKWVSTEEVEELRRDLADRARDTRDNHRRELLEARASLRRLRAEMDLVLRILDMHEAPLQLSPERAHVMYHEATAELRSTAWAPEKLAGWADTFLRMQEEDLLVIARAVGTVPWTPFLRLCVAMIVHVHGREDYKTSLDLQSLHRRLTEGRRRLRVAALCYSDMYETRTGEEGRELKRAALLDSPSSVRESMLKRARAKQLTPST